jgi:hypothetical protein
MEQSSILVSLALLAGAALLGLGMMLAADIVEDIDRAISEEKKPEDPQDDRIDWPFYDLNQY